MVVLLKLSDLCEKVTKVVMIEKNCTAEEAVELLVKLGLRTYATSNYEGNDSQLHDDVN